MVVRASDSWKIRLIALRVNNSNDSSTSMMLWVKTYLAHIANGFESLVIDASLHVQLLNSVAFCF